MVASAAVVDVLPFLNVAGELAAVVCTGYETSEGNVALRVSRPIVLSQYFLCSREGLRIHEEGILAGKGFSHPFENADVELVPGDQMDIADAHGHAVLDLQELTQRGDRMGTYRVLLE